MVKQPKRQQQNSIGLFKSSYYMEMYERNTGIISQVHNLQKLKKIHHLKQLIIFATKSKVTCQSESVFFHLHILE